MKKILAILLFSFCISIPVILPFFHKGYFPTHDGEWAVIRLADMFRSLRDFQIPVRYSGELNFGYGYPLFNFAYPFPYYLGIVVHFLGLGFVNAIKILFAGSVIFSAFFMFLASKALWKNKWAGIMSAILYIYFPYRMVDLYVRGSIGESLSFVLFPLLFYFAIKLIGKPSFLLIGGNAIFVAFLVMTHNVMAVLFMPLYVIFILIQAIIKNKKTISAFFLSIFLGFGLSAFFWIPALFEKSNILLSKIPIADRDLYFVSFKKFIFPEWGYGAPIGPNGFSYQLGLGHLAIISIVILSLLFVFIKNKYSIKERSTKSVVLLTILTLFFIFLLFKPSDFLWKNLPLLSEINYPWVALGILGFLISLLSGFLCKQAVGKYVVIVFVIMTVLMVLPYAKPERYINNPDSYYLTNDATTTSSNELMPLWVKEIPSRRAESKVEITNGNGNIENIFYNSKQVNFSVNALTITDIKINTIYYPGWKIYVDGINTKISYENKQGVMRISVSSGNHIVNAKFEETPLRMISNIISLSTFSVILLMTLLRGKLKICVF